MPVPTYDKFIEPILRYLADHPEGAVARDVREAAAATLKVSHLDRQERLPSGVHEVYKNRAGWAHDRLKRAGLSTSVRRGFWRLTAKGFAYAKKHRQPLSALEVVTLAVAHNDVRLRKTSRRKRKRRRSP
jgi:restriction system protein